MLKTGPHRSLPCNHTRNRARITHTLPSWHGGGRKWFTPSGKNSLITDARCRGGSTVLRRCRSWSDPLLAEAKKKEITTATTTCCPLPFSMPRPFFSASLSFPLMRTSPLFKNVHLSFFSIPYYYPQFSDGSATTVLLFSLSHHFLFSPAPSRHNCAGRPRNKTSLVENTVTNKSHVWSTDASALHRERSEWVTEILCKRKAKKKERMVVSSRDT